ncbi:MAG: hypothetical protein KatS3mg091_282 [Patescibacteria group bacterium]|nr:MAG: hypothetical protein KatS3mg091_282 [Patescibacteria group bacterium]
MIKTMDNKRLTQRLNRIIGQLKGIEKMINQDRSCDEIVTQINAVKRAINGFAKEFLVSGFCARLNNVKDQEELKRALEKAVDL